jgi:hypothetical protein
MEILNLKDPSVKPTDEYLMPILGDKILLWHKVLNFMHERYPDSEGDWNFYNDGKQWVFKMVRKKKTVFWAGLFEGTFRVTFYFGDKANVLIESSDLPTQIKENFTIAKRYGAIRPVSVVLDSDSAIQNIQLLVEIKQKLK